jgi:acetyl esterase/lipase
MKSPFWARLLLAVTVISVIAIAIIWFEESPPEVVEISLGAAGDRLRAHLPGRARATGAGVIICPGEGDQKRALDVEGAQVAAWLTGLGATAFVLDSDPDRNGAVPELLADLRRAIRTVRARASEWNLDPTKIGVVGFSAGGHAAALAGNDPPAGNANAADPSERVSSRPDFMVLCYPLLSTAALPSSRGPNDLPISNHLPPTFIFLTVDDTVTPVETVLKYFAHLHGAGVPSELHVYRKGGHGLGLAKDTPGAKYWTWACDGWMRSLDLLKKD